jgi:hypothetical protein
MVIEPSPANQTRVHFGFPLLPGHRHPKNVFGGDEMVKILGSFVNTNLPPVLAHVLLPRHDPVIFLFLRLQMADVVDGISSSLHFICHDHDSF